ncbi:MAG TPA: glycosyltransferase [Jiangellaceae bacterium]
MKVVLVYPSRPGQAVGNVDRDSLHAHVQKLETTLSDQGHDVSVQKLCHDPVQRMGSTQRELAEQWSEDRPDLVHAHLWTSGLAALATLQQSRIPARVPIVQSFHTLDTFVPESAAQARKWRRLEAAVARSVDQLAASSTREQSDLISLGARRSAISVIPHAVDTDEFKPNGTRPSPSSRRRLVAAGPMAPETGFDIAVQALAKLPDAELVIAAGPPTGESAQWPLAAEHEAERLIAIAERLRVTERIKLIAMPSRERLPELLRSAEIVLCTPWRSAPGTSAIEAMACGRPVVASAAGELLDVVIEGATGVLVPPRRPHALAQAVRDLLDDPVRLEGFGLAAAERAQIRHSWDRVGERLAETYEQVLAR